MDGQMRLDRDFSEFIGFLSAHAESALANRPRWAN
jgi:hypothetical protein